jgi:hypothetical protein
MSGRFVMKGFSGKKSELNASMIDFEDNRKGRG